MAKEGGTFESAQRFAGKNGVNESEGGIELSSWVSPMGMPHSHKDVPEPIAHIKIGDKRGAT